MFARNDSHIEFGHSMLCVCGALLFKIWSNVRMNRHHSSRFASISRMLVAENDWIKCTFDDSHTRLLARLLHSQTHVRYTIFQASSHRHTDKHTNNNIKWQYKVHTVQFPTDLIFDAPVFHAE